MTQNEKETIDSNPDLTHLQDGSIVEWDQDQWWLEGKSRIKDERKFFQTTKGKVSTVGLVMLIVFILIALLGSKRSVLTVPEEPISDDPSNSILYTPLQQQIKKIRSQLMLADPVNRDTPLPQVEMSITIEQE